jgi:hypothetical protein
MKTSEGIKNISPAFIKVSGIVKNMIPDSKGFGYNYTSLGCIIDQVKPILSDNGLCIIQSPTETENQLGIETILLHETGEYFSFVYNIPVTNMKGANNTQQAGAAITYGRRYALSAIFGIATETDTDAAYKKSEKAEKKDQPKEVGEDPLKEEYKLPDNLREDFAKAGKSEKLTDEEKEKYRNKLRKVTSDDDAVLLVVEMEGIISGR